MNADTSRRPVMGRRSHNASRRHANPLRRPMVERLDDRLLLTASVDAQLAEAVSDAMRGPVTAPGSDDGTLGETFTADLKAALADRPVPLTVDAHPGPGVVALRVTITGEGVFGSTNSVQTFKAPWVVGSPTEMDLSAVEQGYGVGYLSARIEALDAAGKVTGSDEADIAAMYEPGRVWDSVSSVMEMEYYRLVALLDAGSISQADFDAGVTTIYAGPAPVAPSGAGIHAMDDPGPVTVSGTIAWTDGAGKTHGVPAAPVEIYEINGATTKLLTASPATTKNDGTYSISVTPDAGFTSLFARAYAKSSYDDVKAQTAGAKTYTMDSATKPISGATLTLDKTGSSAMAATNERAFAVDSVMYLVGSYYSTLAGASLPALDTIFPQLPAPGVSFFSSSSKLMNVRDTAWNQPDVTEHEYGHYVASANSFGASPGGPHGIKSHNSQSSSDGGTLGKAKGDQLAFSEGWATYFSISGQDATNASALNIPTFGDHSYDGLVSFNLDTLAADGNAVGEDNEGSAGGVLWNMYLTSKDPTSTLRYTDKTIFDLMTSAKPNNIGDVWEAAAAKLDTRNKTKLGKIFGDMKIAPVQLGPADNADIKPSDPIPKFEWNNNGANPAYQLDEFKVVFYKDDFSSKVFESPVGEVHIDAANNKSSWTPTADEWKTITAGGKRLKWVVEGKSKTAPASPGGALGYYWSAARTIGAAPGIAFVIDVTGSMTDEIGGVRDALQAYINEIATTLSPGEEAPTIELVTFRDAPAVEITSNNLDDVKAQVATLGASGGGDCPEPSAAALQLAVGDIGPGGTILLATDASSDPGIDLSAVIAKARDKGIAVNPIVSGDCSGIDSPGGDSGPGLASVKVAATTPGTDDCRCNDATSTTGGTTVGPSARALATTPALPIAAPRGGADEPGGELSAVPVTPITVDFGPPIIDVGTTVDTATRLTSGGAARRGLVGSAAGETNVFVVSLKGGTRYGAVVDVDAGAAPLVEVLGQDGLTVLTTHPAFFRTLDSGQVLTRFTVAFTPAADGDYFVRLTNASASNPTFYTLKVAADPLADVTSSIEGFSSVAAATGGAFVVNTDVKSGIIAPYAATLLNIMSSTLGPSVIIANPGSAPEGQTLALNLVGRRTNWRAGATAVAVAGSGVKVLGVDVTSPTTLTALVQVAPDAPTGLRDMTVISALGTSTETAKGSSVVNVTGPLTAPTLLSVETNTLSRGQTADLTIRGANTAWDSTSKLTLGPGVFINSLKVVSPTLITANVTVSPSATIGFRTATVTTTDKPANTQSRAIFVNIGTLAIPEIASISPSTANQGQSLDVIVAGTSTHFAVGSTTADFGSGITVGSVTVMSPTSATVHLIIDPAATLGFRNVVLTTNGESAVLLNGFFVNSATTPPPVASLTSVSPNHAAQGTSTIVTITGMNTTFTSGTPVSFGPGVNFISSVATNATTLIVQITIDANATPGARDVVVGTGTSVVTLTGGFNIDAVTPIPTPVPIPTPIPITPSGFGAGRDAFVVTLYQEILSRNPEAAGLRFWSGTLVQGVKPAHVARAIWNSFEHRVLVAARVAPAIPLRRAFTDALTIGRFFGPIGKFKLVHGRTVVHGPSRLMGISRPFFAFKR